MLYTQICGTQLFVPYICYGKTAQNHSGLNHSSGLSLPG